MDQPGRVHDEKLRAHGGNAQPHGERRQPSVKAVARPSALPRLTIDTLSLEHDNHRSCASCWITGD